MIVAYGYGKNSYAPARTVVGDTQQLVTSFGYGTLKNVSAVFPLRTLDIVMRVSRNIDREVVA